MSCMFHVEPNTSKQFSYNSIYVYLNIYHLFIYETSMTAPQDTKENA